MGKFVKTLVVVSILLGASYAAKADSFTGTAGTGSVTFTGIDVYNVNSSAASNPFGLTQVTCPGGGPCGSNLGASFEVATIIFFSGGGFIIKNTANAPNGHSEGAWEDNAGSPSSIFTVSGSSLGGLTGGTTETASPSAVPASLCAGQTVSTTGWCFNGNDQGGNGILAYKGAVNGFTGVFTAADNSEEVAFSLGPTSTTPEPSSLLMLGSGLLGLMGLGLRRKRVV